MVLPIGVISFHFDAIEFHIWRLIFFGGYLTFKSKIKKTVQFVAAAGWNFVFLAICRALIISKLKPSLCHIFDENQFSVWLRYNTKQLNCQLENVHINISFNLFEFIARNAVQFSSQMPNQMHQSIFVCENTPKLTTKQHNCHICIIRARTMSIIWIGLWHLECGIADFIQWTKHNSNRCAQMCAALSLYLSIFLCAVLFLSFFERKNKTKRIMVFFISLLFQMHVHNWYRLKNVNWFGRSESARTKYTHSTHTHVKHHRENIHYRRHTEVLTISLVVFVSSALFFPRLNSLLVFFSALRLY